MASPKRAAMVLAKNFEDCEAFDPKAERIELERVERAAGRNSPEWKVGALTADAVRGPEQRGECVEAQRIL